MSLEALTSHPAPVPIEKVVLFTKMFAFHRPY